MFGRTTGVRDCSSQVQSTFYSCNIDGVLTGSLIRMDADVTADGDSGGGWSFDNRAYGSRVGVCGGKSVFTIADDLFEAVGAMVILKE